MRQVGPGSAVSSKVNLSAEIVSWSPCLVKHFIKILSTIVDESRVTLCTGESACMLHVTGRRDMPTDIVFNDVKQKKHNSNDNNNNNNNKSKKRSRAETSFKNSYQGAHTTLQEPIFVILFFKFSLVLKFYYQVKTICIMSDQNLDGLFYVFTAVSEKDFTTTIEEDYP